jgi:hypothetical protein
MKSACVVLPFPLVRRRLLIDRQVSHAAWQRPAAAERYIEHQVKVQGDAMRRKGIAEDLIQHELRCFEIAVRSGLVRALSTGES